MSNYDNTKIRPIIALRFDDVLDVVYTVTKPILDKYGIKATICPTTDLIDTGAYITSAHLLQMFNEGHEIASHTQSHKSVGILAAFSAECADEAAVVTELSASKTAIEAIIGEGNCKGIGYPQHQVDETGMRCLMASGYKYGGGGDSSSPASCQGFTGADAAAGLYLSDKQMGRFRLSMTASITDTVDNAKLNCDRIITECRVVQLVFHDVQASPTVNGMTPEQFEYQIKYLYDAGAQFVTFEDLYKFTLGGKHQLLKKNLNIALNGDLRRPLYNDATKPPTWYLTADKFVYSATGGPISSWDGKECGYLGLDYQAHYYNCPIVKAGTYRVSFQIKKGTHSKNLTVSISSGSTVAPTKYTLATETITAANIPADWTTYSYDVAVPAGARKLYLQVRPASGDTGKYHYLSDVIMERIA